MQKKKWHDYINYVLILIAVGFFVWAIIILTKTHEQPKEDDHSHYITMRGDSVISEKTIQDSTHITNAPVTKTPTKLPLEQIIGGIISMLLLLAKALIKKYIIDKNDKPGHDLSQHPIFLTIQQLITREINQITFATEGRTEVFRVMLHEQAKTYQNNIKSFLAQNIDFESHIHFYTKCHELIINTLNDYEKRWVDLGVPDIIIHKYKIIHSDRIALLLKDVDTITEYRIDADYNDALYYALLAIKFVLQLGITNDSVKTLSLLNGEITGLTFNRKLI